MRKTIILFFGPPESGKGTQSDMLSVKLGIPVISPGELLRHETDNKTDIGKKIEKAMSKGKMVSDRIVEAVIRRRLAEKDVKKGFIFDGYPRAKTQLRHFLRMHHELLDRREGVFAVFIDIGDKEAKKRSAGRRVCDCGTAYHLEFNPPRRRGVCDVCGKKIYWRSDDKPKIVGERLKLYHEEMRPVLDFWERSGKLIRINGEQPIKDVYREIVKKVLKIISKW